MSTLRLRIETFVSPLTSTFDLSVGQSCSIQYAEQSINKLCTRPPQYAPDPASWPLTFWPCWKWCPSHVWRGLPLYQF